MKFVPIKRTRCKKCKRFVTCAIADKVAICSQCDLQRFEVIAELHKEAWLKGDC